MKKERGITLIALVVTIVILIILAGISIVVLGGEDGIINKAKEAKTKTTLSISEEEKEIERIFNELEYGDALTDEEVENKKDEIIRNLQEQVKDLEEQVELLEEQNDDLTEENYNLETQITDLNKQIEDLKEEIKNKDIEIADLKKQVEEKQKQINELQSQLDSINSTLAQTNATADKILKGYKAYSEGRLLTGTMANNGSLNKSLNCGESYTIPEGYTKGGKVTANSLASQTQATATENNLSKGKTAWVNGVKITGTGADETTQYNNGYSAGYNAGYANGGGNLSFSVNINARPNVVSGLDQYPISNLDITNYKQLRITGTFSTTSKGYIRILADESTVLSTINNVSNNTSINLTHDISSYSTLKIHAYGGYNNDVYSNLSIELIR